MHTPHPPHRLGSACPSDAIAQAAGQPCRLRWVIQAPPLGAKTRLKASDGHQLRSSRIMRLW
jgi:hypothetical protein